MSSNTVTPLHHPLLEKSVHQLDCKGQFNTYTQQNIAELLETYPILFFKNTGLTSPADFSQVSQTIVEDPLPDYYGGNGAFREKEAPYVLSVSHEPFNLPILAHNELSYNPLWIPKKVSFLCLKPATSGNTSVLVNEAMTDLLSDELLSKFQKWGLTYVLNLAHKSYDPEAYATWQDTFQTTDIDEVQRFCEINMTDFSLGSNGAIVLKKTMPAFVQSPKNPSKSIFLNQAYNANSSYFNELSKYKQVPLEDRPRHTTFGNGEVIKGNVLRQLHEAHEKCIIELPWETGDVLLCDNLEIMHGRTPVIGPRKFVVMMGGVWLRDQAHPHLLSSGTFNDVQKIRQKIQTNT